MSFERTILDQIVHNEEYARRVVPHLKLKYFEDHTSRNVLKSFVEYYMKYNKRPSVHELAQDISDRRDLSEADFEGTLEIVQSLEDLQVDLDWAVDKTEEWCQNRAVELAVFDAISIIEGDDKKRTKHAIPDILQDALSVTFKVKIGHDWLDNAEGRYEFYQDDSTKIPTGIEILDAATNGGIPLKTLNVIQGDTNIGKTMFMCALSSLYVAQGYDVVYFTMEMAEEWIVNRIDSNFMNMSINTVQQTSKDLFMKFINSFRKKDYGRFKAIEYPTGVGNVNLFRNSLRELEAKENFKPKIIMVDYLGIMDSVRTTMSAGTFVYRKTIAEELRAMAKEVDAMMWTGNQMNRSGHGSTDPDLSNTAESYGVPGTADLYLSAVRTEELDELGQLLLIQNKSRYVDKSDTRFRKFIVGIEPGKAKMFNVDSSAQRGINTSENDASFSDDKPKRKSKFEDLEA